MTRLVQIQNGGTRRVALVEEPHLRLLKEFSSVCALAQAAMATQTPLPALVHRYVSDERLDYDTIYESRADWRLLVPLDHPLEPANCLVSGTGLTHLGSAKDRQAMHGALERELTDSMRMFRWGVEGGRPGPDRVGVAPEWFYKGTGTMLRGHGEPLVAPSYAEDGGEEAEVAGLYVIAPDGQPRRVGMAAGNEFSDHLFEKRNYLNLAGSKLRTCSLGPELVVDPQFQSLPGEARIERDGQVLWTKPIRTGEAEMCHSLQNIEHHHFKFEAHRRPGDIHVHYFGAHSLSFGDGVQLADGDVMVIRFEGFGRPLRNPFRRERSPDALVRAAPLAVR
jgi:hypothetical protein